MKTEITFNTTADS